jgi:hypothetical protein
MFDLLIVFRRQQRDLEQSAKRPVSGFSKCPDQPGSLCERCQNQKTRCEQTGEISCTKAAMCLAIRSIEIGKGGRHD